MTQHYRGRQPRQPGGCAAWIAFFFAAALAYMVGGLALALLLRGLWIWLQ